MFSGLAGGVYLHFHQIRDGMYYIQPNSRVCLGINFAKDEVWIFIACLLWGLQFSKPRGDDGLEVEQDVEFTSGFVR
jgi:hypothetical protein